MEETTTSATSVFVVVKKGVAMLWSGRTVSTSKSTALPSGALGDNAGTLDGGGDAI